MQGLVLNRRGLLAAASGGLLAAGTRPAAAAGFADKQVRIVVPFSAGTTLDVMGRTLAEALEPVIAQRPILTNRDGAAGMIALTEMLATEPDGYTWLLSGAGQFTIQPHIRRHLRFQPDQFAPVCQLYETPFTLVVNRDLEIASFDDLMARARRAPRALGFGHYGPGSATHLTMAAIARTAGVAFLEVPYRAQGQLVQDLVTGALSAAILAPGSYDPDLVRHLAVIADIRLTDLPDVPTIIESGQPVPLVSFAGLYVTSAVPAEIRDAIEAACLAASTSDLLKRAARRAQVKLEVLPHGEFSQRIADQSRDMQALIAAMELKID